MKCFIDGCTKESRAKYKSSLCSLHCTQKWRDKNPELSKKRSLESYYKFRDKRLLENKTNEGKAYKLQWHHKTKYRRKDLINKNNYNAHRQLGSRYSTLKGQAKRRGFKVFITKEQFIEIVNAKCYYCNGPLPETGSGLDRIESNKHYTLENVIPCCGVCNRLKCHLLTKNEMTEVIKLLKILRKTEEVWCNL